MYFEHANFTVSNLQRSVELYRKLFGFHVRWQGETADGRPAAHVGTDTIYLALLEASRPGKVEPKYETVGLNHVGLVVDDLKPFRDRLAEAGITPHLERDYDPGLRLYFFDPDGIEFELVQYETS